MEEYDREILERAVRGDHEALTRILAVEMPRVHAIVRLRAGASLKAKESTADLAQSVCREVLGRLDRIDHLDQYTFRRMLAAEAMRKLADRAEHHARARRDVRREASPADRDGDDALLSAYHTWLTPSRHAMAREEIARVESAFDALPEDYRDVIIMSRLAGLSHADIARSLDKSEGAVRKLLVRALAALAEALDRPTP